ncbi:MAG: metal-dependent phosphohydrolase [Deltaproteobacteria bacterium]|nr:MAG: metal-dependent phosphohydrolase [Deltaproteobacteria bacterium]
MQIPTKKQCYQLIAEMGMPDHIVAHSVQVCRVSTLLADHLKIQNAILNRDLVQASALLHDITKIRSFKTGENHAETGGALLAGMGFPEVGRIIAQHVFLDIYDYTSPPTEAEIINYSDKRVLHDTIAPLGQRMDYILQQYGKTQEHHQRIRELWERTNTLEDKLFRHLPFSPEDVSGLSESGKIKCQALEGECHICLGL